MEPLLNLKALLVAKVPMGSLLMEMKRTGTSVLLNWSEGDDSDMWECSWIVGGIRYTAFAKVAEWAVEECAKKVLSALSEN